MTEKTLNTVIVLRNDKSTDWAKSEVILREGELGVSYLDNGKVVVKAGNGIDKWASLKQVEGVFEENVTLTKDFGYYDGVPSGGKKTFENTAGMTISEFILSAYQQTVEPKISSYPELQFSLTAHTTDTGTNEIGSNITSVSYEGKVKSAGAYDVAGKSVGSGLDNGDTTWSVTYSGTTKTDRTGSFTTNVKINSTSAANYCTCNATGTMNFADVVIPTNNLGTSRPEAKITKLKNGATSQDMSASRNITGYRDTWYYVGADYTFELNSANIRSKATAKGSNTTSFGRVTIPGGTKRVMFAVLGDKTLTSVIDVDGQGLDVKANFTKETIAIEGANGYEAANYTVFHFENENGVAATKYDVTIG
jgi:hypothetical protein